MINRQFRPRLDKIQAAIAARALAKEASSAVSDTLAIIASVRPDTVRLSEIDRKRWHCPHDPRSIITAVELEEEIKIRARVLEKCAQLGFPDGYLEMNADDDQKRLLQISEKETIAVSAEFTVSQQAEKAIIEARREALYEVGPRHCAHMKMFLVGECLNDPFACIFNRTIFEWHECDHLMVLHPTKGFEKKEIPTWSGDQFNSDRRLWISMADEARARLDEWHANIGKDPRHLKKPPHWMMYPTSADAFDRQNQQLAQMGFEPDRPQLRK